MNGLFNWILVEILRENYEGGIIDSTKLSRGYAYLRGYAYCFCQIFQGLRLFRGLRLLESLE